MQKIDEIMAAYEANQSESSKRNHSSQFDEIDEVVYQWYSQARQRQVPVTSPIVATGRSLKDS